MGCLIGWHRSVIAFPGERSNKDFIEAVAIHVHHLKAIVMPVEIDGGRWDLLQGINHEASQCVIDILTCRVTKEGSSSSSRADRSMGSLPM